MLTVGRDIRTFDIIFIVITIILSFGIALFVPVEYLPWTLAGLGIVIIMILWANFGDITTLILLWFITVACFSYFFWKKQLPVPGFGGFNITVDRLFILGIFIIALISLVLGTLPYKPPPKVIKMFFLMMGYFTLSLFWSGFRSIADVSPHFRLTGGYYFPAVVMVLAYWAVNDEPQLKKVAWFFLGFGLYLTITAWAEHLKLWSIVFPRYIANPELGIHWGRARGPFLVSASLGITLVFCFFNNLYLARRLEGPIKGLMYFANMLMLPAIFFTQTRSVWLAMIICGLMWIVLARGIRSRAGLFFTFVSAAVVIFAIFYADILSRQRTKGGVTDPYPVYARIGLAKITLNVVKSHPITGVGFGHFRDYAASYSQDPTSKYIRFGSRLMEHNNFLSILAETGIIGLTLYLLVLWRIFQHSKRLYYRIPPEADGWVSRDVGILFWILLADYIIDAMFRETSVDPFNNGLLFAFTGIILAIDYLLEYRPAKVPDIKRIQQASET